MTVERVDVSNGHPLPDLVLGVGDSAKVDVGTAHRPFNPGPGRCRFVIIQGFGHKDFLPFTPPVHGA